MKFANGRSVTNIVKCLGKCLPGGARLFNSYFLKPKMSYRLKSCHYIANINFTAAYTNCLNELSNIDYTDKELRSWNDIVNVFVKCMEGKGQLRVEKKMYDKILDEIGELKSQPIKMTR